MYVIDDSCFLFYTFFTNFPDGSEAFALLQYDVSFDLKTIALVHSSADEEIRDSSSTTTESSSTNATNATTASVSTQSQLTLTLLDVLTMLKSGEMTVVDLSSTAANHVPRYDRDLDSDEEESEFVDEMEEQKVLPVFPSYSVFFLLLFCFCFLDSDS
jgi:hypothetical protein